jgi:stage III sporulation protein AB
MMRYLGAAAVIAGCGGFGFSLAAAARKECGMLRILIRVIQQMQWELKYRMTELPELCRTAAETGSGVIREIFEAMAGKLERREVEDVSAAFMAELNRHTLPRHVRRNLKQLANNLGRYDLEGQLHGLEAVRQQCRTDLSEMESERKNQMRCYETLAVCAGASLAIIFF